MSEKIKKIISEIEDIEKVTDGFSLLKHLFSKDEAVKNIAKLNRGIHQIKVLLKLTLVKEVVHKKVEPIRKDEDSGKFARVRYASDEKPGTFLAIYLGDAPTGTSVGIEDDKIECELINYNPCLFVIEKNEIVFGYESWWNIIESPEELSEITDLDIDSVWYVKAMKQLAS